MTNYYSYELSMLFNPIRDIIEHNDLELWKDTSLEYFSVNELDLNKQWLGRWVDILTVATETIEEIDAE